MSVRTLYLDTETFCATPIKNGTHRYAEDAEIMLVTWAIGDSPVYDYDATTGDARPLELMRELHDPTTRVVIHNSHFDRTILRHSWGIDIPTSRIHDTMVQALSHGLPASLGDLGGVLGLPANQAKDKAGKKLINLFCKPLGKNRTLRRATSETHPSEWSDFRAYARSDIEAMREVMKRMPVVNMLPAEHELWQLDQRINDRGVQVDLALVGAAIAAVDTAKVDLVGQTLALTGGGVESTTQTAAFRLHLFETFGVDMPDMRMATVEKFMADESTPPGMAAMLEIRLQASSTSTSKYRVLERGTSVDGRLRGTLQFNGASRTGRWAGRLFQPQNLPRPSLKQPVIDAGIQAMLAGCAHLTTDNVMELTSSAIRSCLIAPKGKKLVVADLANIEGRVQAWLAGENWKIQAFRDYDTVTGFDAKGKAIRKGHDLYKMAYAKAFGIRPEDVTDDQRQVGKVMELALAYAGGVGAFVTFAGAYGIDLDALAEAMLPSAPEWAVNEADDFLNWCVKDKRETYGLSPEAFVACDALKRMWRAAHPNVSGYWPALNKAVLESLEQRGETISALNLRIKASKNWLFIELPSGRSVCYPSPKVFDTGLTYMGIDQFTRKWVRQNTHGGKLFENCCQAIARDVMAENMRPIENAGYNIVLSVHDELITETPDDPEFSSDNLSALLSANPWWAPDMPLAAAGFETHRYRKG
jgi:DNA polymerase